MNKNEKEPSMSGFSNTQLRKLSGNGEYQRRLDRFNGTVDKSFLNKEIKELDNKERYKMKMKTMRNSRLGETNSNFENIKKEVKEKVQETKEEKAFENSKTNNKRYKEKMRKLNKKYGEISVEEYLQLNDKIACFEEEQKEMKKDKKFTSNIYMNVDEHYIDINKINLHKWQQTKIGISKKEADNLILGDEDDNLSDISDDE